MSNKELWIAGQASVDSLKMEFSTLSPARQELTIEFVRGVTSIILESYKDNIPDKTREKVQSLPQRIVTTDAEMFQTIRKSWGQDAEGNLDAIYFGLGNIIFLKDTKSLEYVWDRMPLVIKNSWKTVSSNEQAIKEKLAKNRYAHILIHEIFHDFHPLDSSLAPDFLEHGVSHYTDTLTRRLKILDSFSLERLRGAVYASFAHPLKERVFFGSETSHDAVLSVSSEYAEHSKAKTNMI